MKKPVKWSVAIIIACAILIIFISILPKSEKQRAAEEQKTEDLAKIKQQIREISADQQIAKFISCAKVEDDGSVCQIWVELLFEPDDYQQVKTWTDAVCESSKRILDAAGISRDISVWANRPDPKKKGNVILYGRTFYSHYTGESEFKSAEELNL